MKNMLLRYLVAVIAIPLIVLLLMAAPSWMFNMFVIAVMFIVHYEWLMLFRALKLAAPAFLGLTMYLIMSCGIWAFAVFKDGFLLYVPVIMIILGSTVFGLINLHHDIKQKILGCSAVLMALFLCSWGGCSLVLIRETASIPDGRYWILLLFTMAWTGDAGAMHTGRLIGRHKLTPIISPKKTIEGLAGGIVASTAAGVAIHHYLPLGIPWWHILLLGPATVLLAHVGDLTASMTKRAAGVKDSGRLIPGHGGFLDRFDNLLLTAPMMYIYIRIFIE